jgi:hypothetical protein
MPLWTYGTLTALVSAFGAGVLYLFLSDRTAHAGLKAFLVFVFPMFLIESVTAMDYMWGLCFGVAALYLVSRRMMFWVGVAIGLAISARVTSCLFIPVAILIFLENSPNRNELVQAILAMSVGTAITAGLFFALPYSVYGWEFLRFYDVPYPNSSIILYRTTFAFGGTSGAMLTFGLLIYSCILQFRSDKITNQHLSYGFLCGASLYALLFLRAPFESGYLIPCAFFALVHAAIWVPSRRYTVAAGLVALNGLVDVSPMKMDWGNVVLVQTEKAEQMARSMDLSEKVGQLQPDDVLIAGYLEPSIVAISPNGFQHDQVKYYMTKNDIKRVRSRGGTIYFVRELAQFIESDSGISLRDFAAKPL